MAVDAADIEFAKDLFSDLGAITSRKMMGGAVLYADGALFATLDSEGTLYIRSKGPLADRLLAAGETAFTWTNPKTEKTLTMGYVTIPGAALDDPDEACALAREALSEA